MSYGVERLSAHPKQAVVEALRASFDLPFTDEFFEWKHVEGPWGPTDGWVAVDDEGIAGVLCCMPWGLRRDGTTSVASRLVDGGTVPRALRQGIFGELVRHEVERCQQLSTPQSIFCTATPAARDSHVKRGATALAPLRHGIGVVPVHRAGRAVTFDDAIDQYVETPSDRVETAWSTASLRWRFEARSGHRYECARLRSADGPNGLVFRVGSTRGLRQVFVEFAWGDRRDVAALIAGVAVRRGALAWSAPAGEGAALAMRPVTWRGVSHVCSWPFDPTFDAMRTLSDARLWYADVEGLI